MSHPVPQIAVVVPNTLAALGMADILHRLMPGAEVALFGRAEELVASAQPDGFFHYFVSASEVLLSAQFFLARQHKTIVLVHGDDAGQLPKGFHTLNVYQSEKQLIRSIVQLAQRSHQAHGAEPAVVRQAQHGPAPQDEPQLTPREREVLRGVVEGLINKEIAHRLGVSLTTVITHRKNLTDKLGTKSVAALTIYAVTHGIARSEEL